MTPNAVMPASTRIAAPTSSPRDCRRGGGAPGGRLALGSAAAGGSSAGSWREDLLVQALQLGARLDADLVDEPGARRRGRPRAPRPGGRSGTARASAARAGAPAAGARRRARRARRAPRDGGQPRGRRRSRARRPEAQVVEPADLGGRERLVRDVGERAPRHSASASRARRPPSRRSNARASSRNRQLQLVAAAARDDLGVVAAERPAQMRHVGLDHLRRVCRQLVAPGPSTSRSADTVRPHRARASRTARAACGGRNRRARPRGEPRAAPRAARPSMARP